MTEDRLDRGRKGQAEEFRVRQEKEEAEKVGKEITLLYQKHSALLRRKAGLNESIAHLEDQLSNLGAVRRTKTDYLMPSESKQIHNDAKNEYINHLKRIFEGANLRVVGGSMEVLELSGMRFALGHKLSNSSSASQKGAMASSADMYTRMQLFGLQPNEIDFVLFTHHPGTKCWVMPNEYSEGQPIHVFQQGGLSNPRGLQEAHNRGIKIPRPRRSGNPISIPASRC